MGNQLDKMLEEIEFWQKEVDEFNGQKDSEVYERMLQALNLAEYRFSSACGAQASSSKGYRSGDT